MNLDDLIDRYKSYEEFNKYDNALDLIDKIRNGETDLAEEKNNRNIFKIHLGEIKKEVKNQKNEKNTIHNIEMLYEARKEAIKFFDDYSLLISEAKNKAKNNTSSKGLKILIPKKML